MASPHLNGYCCFSHFHRCDLFAFHFYESITDGVLVVHRFSLRLISIVLDFIASASFFFWLLLYITLHELSQFIINESYYVLLLLLSAQPISYSFLQMVFLSFFLFFFVTSSLIFQVLLMFAFFLRLITWWAASLWPCHQLLACVFIFQLHSIWVSLLSSIVIHIECLPMVAQM